MDTTSINDLPGENIKMTISENNQDMNEIVSGIQSVSGGGVINLPSRDIPNEESNISMDKEVQQNKIPETIPDYIKNIETNEELISSIKKDEISQEKQITLYDSIHRYVIMACVFFLFQLPFFHKMIMMKYFVFGLNSDGNPNIKGYLIKTLLFVSICYCISEGLEYIDRV